MMTPSEEAFGRIEHADGPNALAGQASDARAALSQLHFEADVARRAAINARLTAERDRLAGYTRERHRP